MLDVLFTIPYQIGDVPIFGFGLLFWLWALASGALLGRLVYRQGLSGDTLSYLPVLALLGAMIVLLPKLFPGGLPIRGYGMMMLVGVSAALGLAVHRARQMGVDPEIMYSLAFWLFVGGIAGGRIFHVIEYWNRSYRKESLSETILAVVQIWNGGLVVFGGVLVGAVAFVIFALRRRIPMLALGDLIAPSLMLALSIGRIGCLLHGCCYGGECQRPWAVTFPAGSPPYMDQLVRGRLAGLELDEKPSQGVVVQSVEAGSIADRAGLRAGDRIRAIQRVEAPTLDAIREVLTTAVEGPIVVETVDGRSVLLPSLAAAPRSLPVHPTQVYSAIDALLLCMFLLAYYPFRRRDGEVLALLFTIHPLMRILLEQIRKDEPGVFAALSGFPLRFSISQVVSLLFLTAVSALWFYILRRPPGSVLPVRV